MAVHTLSGRTPRWPSRISLAIRAFRLILFGRYPRPSLERRHCMFSKRTALLGMLICLTGAVAYGQPAVIAPTVGGDIGLFTMTTADAPRAGQFTLGFYGWYAPRFVAPIYVGEPDQNRWINRWGGNVNASLGLTNWWSVFVSGGGQVTRSGGGWQGGILNAIPLQAPFRVSEGQKIRLGTKISFHSEADSDLRFGVWLAGLIPVNSSDVINPDGTLNRINTDRADWEWGGAVTKGWFTGMVSYQLSGQPTCGQPTACQGAIDNDIRVPNILRFGVGAEIPVLPIMHVLVEGWYNVYDGGDFPEPDYGALNVGGRFWIGRTGWAVSAALSTNLSML